MKTSSIILLLLILCAIVAGAYYFSSLIARQKDSDRVPAITRIEVQRPDLVIMGNNLAGVEIWAIPEGTNVDESSYTKLGNAALASPHGDGEIWIFTITKNPVLATQIFAKGLDASGTEVGRVFLPYAGATDLYNAIWGNPQALRR